MRRILFALLSGTLLFTACSPNNVTIDDTLGKSFDSAGIKGCFGFYDNGQGHFTIYNLTHFRDSLYQPAGTFDILQSLIAIQTGVAKNDSMLRPAFQTDSLDSLGFTALAAQIGRDTLKKWIDSLQYGNKNLSSTGTDFWHDNQLKINCDQQLGLIKKLYFDQLPFYKRPQELVRGMMSGETNSNYKLRYKTAKAYTEDGRHFIWATGWVEENTHPYFFVLNAEAADPHTNLEQAAETIIKGFLNRNGFFHGKK